ncbi:MAG: hypothetical protein ABI200_02700 [Gaiellales bacterium]
MRIPATAPVPMSAPGQAASTAEWLTLTPPPTAVVRGAANPWTNPVAAAALRSAVDLLGGTEEGIIRNFADTSFVRQHAAGLRSTAELFSVATDVLRNDASIENDAFLPLVTNAGTSVSEAEFRLSAREITSTWPLERSEILASIQRARALSQHIADQLDPRSMRSS